MEAGRVSAFKGALVLESQLAAEVKDMTRRGAMEFGLVWAIIRRQFGPEM